LTTTTARSDTDYAECELGALARDIPGATAVLREHHLDFCCGGRQTLAEAAQSRGLNVGAISAQLAALDTGAPPDAPTDADSLIDHIVTRFHEGHRRELPELIALAAKVEQVHAGHPEVPAGLAALLQAMRDALQTHMQKEEQILFPMMRRHPGGFLAPPTARMREEHAEHGEMLENMRAIAHDFVPPQQACNTWRALYAGLAHFHAEFMEHVHTENYILFPQFETAR